MERQIIQVQYPTLDHTESVANICIEKTVVDTKKGITIEDAFDTKHNSLFIVLNNLAADSFLTVKAGDIHSSSQLGDITIELPAGTSAFQLQDLSRFEKSDGSIDLDFSETFEGTIFAVARWAGIRELVEEK